MHVAFFSESIDRVMGKRHHGESGVYESLYIFRVVGGDGIIICWLGVSFVHNGERKVGDPVLAWFLSAVCVSITFFSFWL